MKELSAAHPSPQVNDPQLGPTRYPHLPAFRVDLTRNFYERCMA
jgi:hypothetical protein